jgi:phage terminase small subunit
VVQARIAEIMRAGAERAEVTVEQVVRELKLLGFSDIRKVVSWRNELVTRTEKGEDGEPVMVMMPRVTIVDADKISDEAAAAVAEVSQTVNGALRVKMHDKACCPGVARAPIEFDRLVATVRRIVANPK